MLRESFHNTIQLDPVQLSIDNLFAVSQEEMILSLYKRINKPMAYFEVWSFFPDMDKDSVKRAISNLAREVNKDGSKNEHQKLTKIKDKSLMVIGTKGKPCHRYRLIK